MDGVAQWTPGVLAEPDEGRPRCAVLVLSGSSGRLEAPRAKLLAAHGALAASMTSFGGPGQPPRLCEVPLETFEPVLDRLAERSEHLAILGVSKGAEAALLLAARDPRVRTVIALAPTSVVWAGISPDLDGRDQPWRSSWTRGGRPVPFLPYANGWTPNDDELDVHGNVAVRGWYEASIALASPAARQAAAIEVERIAGHVLVAAGGDDRVWPSVSFAEQIAARRDRHQLVTTLLVEPRAGHRVRLPGEPTLPRDGGGLRRGGTPEADTALGAMVWQYTTALLDLKP